MKKGVAQKRCSIPKRELEELLRKGKRRKDIANRHGVSIRTVGRYIRRYGLVGIAKRGRPPKLQKGIYFKRKRRPIRTYRMTIASTWYDKQAQHVREFELHFKAVRSGEIRNVRRYMAKRGVPYFQQTVYRLYKRWIPKRKIRVSFEREEPARKPEQLIQIEVRRMEGKGKRWKAFPLPSRVLTYEKQQRKRK